MFNRAHLYHKKQCLPLVDEFKWLYSQTLVLISVILPTAQSL